MPNVIYVDMTDLIEYAKHNTTVSGIQRVVANILNNVEAWRENNNRYDVIPVVPEYDKGKIYSVDLKCVLKMVEML